MGKVGNGKVGKGKGKAGGKGKAKDQGGDAHNKQTRPLVCHPSVLQHSEIIIHPTIASASQKLREAEEGWIYIYMEGKRMVVEDQISSLQMQVGRLAEAPPQIIIEERVVEKTVIVEKVGVQEKIVVEEKIVYVDRSPASSKSSTSRPEPKFKAGQAVHRWWAPWMAGATTSRESIGKKGRPAWYSASVMLPPEWAETAYGGIIATSWAYRVF